MRRFLLILAMGLMLLPSFGRKVIVLEVTKEGDGWQNLFNLYREVTTTYVGNQNGVPCVNLSCTGAGYSWCRASREIGEMNYGMSNNDANNILSNEQIINAINSLIEASETAYAQNSRATSSSKKVAVQNGNKTTLYFIKASWRYDVREAHKEAKIVITIEVDDGNMLNQRV